MNDRLRTALLLLTLVGVSASGSQGASPKVGPPPTRTAPPKAGLQYPDGIGSGSDTFDNSLDPKGDAARSRQLFRLETTARTAFARSDLRRTRRACQSILFVAPSDVTAACMLADVDIQEGRAQDASEVLVRFVRAGAGPDVRMRSALATGLLGRTRPDEELHCRGLLSRLFSASLLEGSLPPKGGHGSATLVAALALGAEAASHVETARTELYYGIALRLDPGNPLANLELSRIDAQCHRFRSAHERLQIASKRGGQAVRKLVQQRTQEFNRLENKKKVPTEGKGAP